jgi:hypothetical protein
MSLRSYGVHEAPPRISRAGIDDSGILPSFTPNNLSRFIREGFVSIGVAHALVEPGPDPRVMMFEHRKTRLLGLLSENLKETTDGGIEHPMHASARCFKEELCIDDVSKLGLVVARRNGWKEFAALRHRYTEEWLVGVASPLYTDTLSLEQITEQMSTTDEISGFWPMRLNEIYKLGPDECRPFALMGLIALESSGLLLPEKVGPLVPYNPPTVDYDSIQHDLNFGTVTQVQANIA